MVTTAMGEWKSESFTLNAGWNAIYPLVDASYTTIDELTVAHPDIVEVWRWQPDRVDGRDLDPTLPPVTGAEWAIWRRGLPAESSFVRLQANRGYLVRLRDGATPLNFSLVGQAVAPDLTFRSDGLNLVGFPVVEQSAPRFIQYLSTSGIPLLTTTILQYNGGDLVDGINPRRVNPTATRVNRGRAYWIRAEQFSGFYGPLAVNVDGGNIIDFGESSQSEQITLTNLADRELTVTLRSAVSAAVPAGQPALTGAVPVSVRPSFALEASDLASPLTVTLPANSRVVVEISLDRSALAGSPDDRFGSLLVLETEGEEVSIGMVAEVGSLSGLWLGDVQITHVGSVRRTFLRDAEGNTVFDSDTGAPTLTEDFTTGTSGALPQVARPYPLRLIVHLNTAQQATLLSHIFTGILAGESGVNALGLTLDEAALDPSHLNSASRLSVAHLPIDTVESLGSGFGPAATLNATVTTAHDSPANPFIHTYHPDHDNLTARYETQIINGVETLVQLPAGLESFTITRKMSLIFDAEAPEGAGSDWGSTFFTGTFREDVGGLYRVTNDNSNAIRTEGRFALRRVSTIPELTEAP